jgi:hypothetical protein
MNSCHNYRGIGGCHATRLPRRYSAELVALAPDVLLAGGGLAVRPLQSATRTIPIVFTNANDPISFGFVETLARPLLGRLGLCFELGFGRSLRLRLQLGLGVTDLLGTSLQRGIALL